MSYYNVARLCNERKGSKQKNMQLAKQRRERQKRKSTRRESARGTSTSAGSKEKLAERLRAGGAGLFAVGARALAMAPVVVAGENPGMRGSGAGAGRVLPLSACTKDIFIYLQMFPQACIHAHMHACIYKHAHTYIHAYMHACMYAYIHSYINTCIYTYTHI